MSLEILIPNVILISTSGVISHCKAAQIALVKWRRSRGDVTEFACSYPGNINPEKEVLMKL